MRLVQPDLANASLDSERVASPILHVGSARFNLPVPRRPRNPFKDALSITTSTARDQQTWLTAPEEGFYGQTVRVHVPQDGAMTVQLYHSIEAGHDRKYLGCVDVQALFIPMWLMDREVGYIVGWEKGDTRDLIRLLITNPERPDQPLIIEIVKQAQEEIVTILGAASDSNCLTIERYL